MATEMSSVQPSAAQPAPSTKRSAQQTLANALIITRREVRDSFRDWRIVTPIIVLTFFFPFLAQSVATNFASFLEGFGADLVGERTIPFLLMIVGFFPISISLVIALESFVGEKERRSLEPLLSTPLTNTELYIGKTLSAMIPPLLASAGGMTFYLLLLVGSDLAWRPQPALIVQIFLLTIVQALVMITGAVVVSSQTTSTRAANLLASFIIIPMALVVNGESVIMFLAPDADSPAGIGALWAIIIGMTVVVILLLRIGNSIFNREELLGRTIDNLRLKSTFRKIGRYTVAVDDDGTPARNLWDWYRRAVPYSLRKLRTPLLLTVIVFSVAFVAGYIFGQFPQYQLPLPDSAAFDNTLEIFQDYHAQSIGVNMGAIIWQNSSVLLGTLLLSVFTFGVFAFIIPPLTLALLGYLLSQMLLAQYDLTLFFAALLPHGIAEIPMIALATAVIFRLGAVVTRPPAGQTVGHTWLVTIGDTLKVALGVIGPLLLLSAVLEVYVTPRIVIAMLGG